MFDLFTDLFWRWIATSWLLNFTHYKLTFVFFIPKFSSFESNHFAFDYRKLFLTKRSNSNIAVNITLEANKARGTQTLWQTCAIAQQFMLRTNQTADLTCHWGFAPASVWHAKPVPEEPAFIRQTFGISIFTKGQQSLIVRNVERSPGFLLHRDSPNSVISLLSLSQRGQQKLRDDSGSISGDITRVI